MRRALPTVGVVAVAALLQAGLAPYVAIGGVTPNFLLIVTSRSRCWKARWRAAAWASRAVLCSTCSEPDPSGRWHSFSP